MKPIVQKKIEDLQTATNTHIQFQHHVDPSDKPSLNPESGSKPQEIIPLKPSTISLEIIGLVLNCEKARIKCLLLMDELLGLTGLQVSIPFKMHFIVAGRKREAFFDIMFRTSTCIYVPIPFLNKEDTVAKSLDCIYITGEPKDVEEAAHLVNQLYSAVVK